MIVSVGLLYLYPRSSFFVVGVISYLLQQQNQGLKHLPLQRSIIPLIGFIAIMAFALPYTIGKLGPRDYLHLFTTPGPSLDNNQLCYLAALPAFFYVYKHYRRRLGLWVA